MECDKCDLIVRCKLCGKRLCSCACQTCTTCAGQAAAKKVEECDCPVAQSKE